MERFMQWFERERDKIMSLSPKARLVYIWDYYKIWIICIVTGLYIVIAAGTVMHNTLGENWLYVCFANTYANIGSESTFCRSFADYAGYDLRRKNLVFNTDIYCQPSNERFNDVYYRNLIAFLDSGTMDVLVMEEQEIQAVGASGRLLDLADPRVKDIYEKYQDRLVYCEPLRAEEYGADQFAVGIDLSGSVLVGEYKAYPDGCVLGISSQSHHMDQVECFLEFLFREEEE